MNRPLLAAITANAIAAAFFICIQAAQAAPMPDKVTYAEHIAPMIHENCTSCHQPGQAGPFSLVTYKDVRKRSRTIESVIEDRYMPPWKPVQGHGNFLDERYLSDKEIALFKRWLEQGREMGDESNMPEPPVVGETGWPLGKPDLVLTMAEAFPIPAGGPDIYRWFALPMNLTEDKWVKAIDFRPSSRAVVHHSLYFLDATGQARALDGKDGKPGFRGMRANISGRLGGYVPGNTPRFLPEDLALPMPKGSDFVLQTHFHPTGKKEMEKSQVAIYFAKEAPSKKLLGLQMPPAFGMAAGIDVAPGQKDFKINTSFTLPVDAIGWTVGGHAHYICSDMKMTATRPGGKPESLLYIDDWDLDWQDTYHYKKPVELPAGTVIDVEIAYDNSASNPDNPFSPPQRIRWGRESTDEMGSMTINLTAANKAEESKLQNAIRDFTRQSMVKGRRQITKRITQEAQKLNEYDKNGDGKIAQSELPATFSRFFKRIDQDQSGFLEKKEIERLQKMMKRFGQ